jgi:hypothetical protein
MATMMNEPLSRHALAFVLAGGRGSRLLELTDKRAKPAVYFGGKWQVHMSAGRLRVYLAPCTNVGFGTCDQGFSEIFLANQFNPFPLHRKATSNDWYARPENIP